MPADCPGPSGGPFAMPRSTSDKNSAKLTSLLRIVRQISGYRTTPCADRPASDADNPPVENQRNPKLSKRIFRAGADRLRTKGRPSACRHRGKTAVDLAVGLSDITVVMLDSTVGGSRTVRALAADRPPVQILADAP
jgi:hypothetical protein